MATPDNRDPILVDILEASTAAAEKFQAENAAIDKYTNHRNQKKI